MSVFSSLLNRDFLVFRRVRTSDGQGGWPFVPTQIGEVRGRIRPVSGVERTKALEEGRELSHVFYQVAGGALSVARGDTLVTEGLMVEVMAVREPSKAGEHLEVDCREQQGEVNEVEVGS